MIRKLPTASACAGVSRRSFAAGAGAAGLLAGTAPFNIGRAQGAPLKVGVILPLSGAQASIGQDCYRGVEIAPGIFKALGLPELAVMKADTETNVEVARARAEKLINDGAQLLVATAAADVKTEFLSRLESRTEELIEETDPEDPAQADLRAYLATVRGAR